MRSAANPRRLDVVFYLPTIGALVSHHRPQVAGGAEIQILTLARHLAAQGVAVGIVVYGSPEDLPDTVDGVRIIPRVPFSSGGGPLSAVREASLICRSVWCFRRATIVTRCAGSPVGILALLTRIDGRRMVYSLASSGELDTSSLTAIIAKRRDRILYRLGLRLADAIVLQTDHQADRCPLSLRRKATVIRSIVPDAAPAVAGEAFLWAGRTTTTKQPLKYLELARALPDETFWMIPVAQCDRDPVLAELQDAVRDVPNLQLLTPRSHAEVGKLVARSIACINTSKFEGMPNVLLEGWARGVPAVSLAYDPGGVIEAHGLGSLAHGNFERFVELVRALSIEETDPTLRERCRRYMALYHSVAIVTQHWRTTIRC